MIRTNNKSVTKKQELLFVHKTVDDGFDLFQTTILALSSRIVVKYENIVLDW